MKSKIIHRCILKCAISFAVAVLFILSTNQAYADEPVRRAIVLEKSGSIAYSQIYQEKKLFNSIILQSDDEIEGLMVNFDPMGKGVWESVEMHDDGFGANTLIFTSPTQSVQFKQINPKKSRIFLNADFIFSDDKSVNYKKNLYAAASTSSSLSIISRSEWSADESYRYWTPELKEKYQSVSSDEKDNGDPCGDFSTKYESETKIASTIKYSQDGYELIWPLAYASQLRKIVVHHTDSDIRDITGDNVMDGNDYAAMVRAIYHFHAKTRGWGDIGYNYLIDPLGNIYEGRYGGDKVIGAHVLCHNNGSMGIALIGNYENNIVPEPALNSLIKLIAQRSQENNIDPEAVSSFRGKIIPNVVGHKDLRSTACPGINLYGLLSKIRERAGLISRIGNVSESGLTQTLDYDASLKGSLSTIELLPNERKKVYLQFQNTGKRSWDNNTWLHVTNSDKQKGAHIVPVVSDKKFVAADMKENTVAAGEIATFEVELEGGYLKESVYFEVAPVADGKFKISKSSIFIPVYVKSPIFSYEVVSSNLPGGIVFQDQKFSGTIKFKNTGNVRWVNYGDNPIRMGTENLRDRRSVLMTTHATRIGHLLESEVLPGATGTFYFDLEAPSHYEGSIKEYFSPVVEHVTWLNNTGLNFEVTVKQPKHSAEITNNVRTIQMMPGEMKEITFTIKNTGDLSWEKDIMNISLLSRGVKIFTNNITPDKTVKPNGSFDADFWVQAPYEQGSYLVFLNSKFNRSSIENGAARLSIEVSNPFLRAQIAKRTSLSVNADIGSEKEIEVQFKNMGHAVWRNNGKNAINLAPTRPQDHLSRLYYNKDWVNEYRAASMVEKEVKPGSIGTFKFKIKPDKTGVFTEYFQLVMENVGWIDGTFIRWDVNVLDGGPNSGPSSGPSSGPNSGSIVSSIDSTIGSTTGSTTGSTIGSSIGSTTETPFRVKISYEDDISKITADKNYKVLDKNGNQLFSINAGYYFTATRLNDNIHVQFYNISTNSDVIRVVPESGGIIEIMTMERRPTWNTSLNDNQFRGIMEIRSVNSKTAFINELPVEDYLNGLAEVSNDAPAEKQKAIAILARTYARFYMESANRKFPGLPYDGSDDPAIFQKYLGYGVEKRSPNFTSAVTSTKNKVVTYNGNLVKTPYFNQSDGKTLSAKEVWGWTDAPYLSSVDDPYCKGLTKQGHGVGMSGCGAEGMAKAGKTYEEIIKYYYNGVGIELSEP